MKKAVVDVLPVTSTWSTNLYASFWHQANWAQGRLQNMMGIAS